MAKKYVVKPRLTDSSFPTHDEFYKEAHRIATKFEKRKYPKGFEELKHLDMKVSKHELIGKNLKSGKIEVSKRVPKRLRNEVVYHEHIEHENIMRMTKNSKKKK